MMNALANSAAFWVVLVLVLCAVYLLPTIIGAARRVDRLAMVFLVNLIGGTTGVGWLAALILACGPGRLLAVRRLVRGPLPDRPPVPSPLHTPADAHDVIVMRASGHDLEGPQRSTS
jgi:hypothetical protein